MDVPAGPVLPGIVALNPDAERQLGDDVLELCAGLERVIARYRSDPHLRAFLDAPDSVRAWVLRDDAPAHQRIDSCRLDLQGTSAGRVRVLEVNSNPGGVFVGAVNRAWRQAPGIGEVLAEWGTAVFPFEEKGWPLNRILALGDERSLPADQLRRIALLHPPAEAMGDQEFAELHELRRQARAAGLGVVMTTPSMLRRADGIRLGYLRCHPHRLAEDIREWGQFCGDVVSGRLVIPNSFAQRWLVDNKLSLAVLSDPRFRDLFSDTEHRALRALVPFSRKLGDGIDVTEARSSRGDLVIKAPFSSMGKSVYIGRQHSIREWADLLRAHPGWLVQEYVAACPVTTTGGSLVRDLGVHVADGHIAGYTSRVHRTLPINVARGARVQAVFANAVH